MKKHFIGFFVVIIALTVFSNVGRCMEKYEGDRIVDATACTVFLQNQHAFLNCINFSVICQSDMVMNDPIGEYFGVKVYLPEEVDKWVHVVFRSNWTDTKAAEWCRSKGFGLSKEEIGKDKTEL